jgi:hypothetical protein
MRCIVPSASLLTAKAMPKNGNPFGPGSPRYPLVFMPFATAYFIHALYAIKPSKNPALPKPTPQPQPSAPHHAHKRFLPADPLDH